VEKRSEEKEKVSDDVMMNEVSPIKITRFLKKFKILRPTILLFQIFHSGFRQDQFIPLSGRHTGSDSGESEA